jgi:hypothetical protein
VEEETRNKYLACVVSAQLVSKFLGFVQFYSYKPMTTGSKLSEQSVIAQVALRENVIPWFVICISFTDGYISS